MMMTCRLLCALLVLALCCCPSVCVTADVVDKANNSGEHSGLKDNQTEEPKQVTDPQSTISPLLKVSEVVKLTAEPQGDRIQEQDREKDEKPTNEEADGDETDNAKDQNQKNNAINTTTTTTQAPTTTTTTTTTTTPAPVAPSTTTTTEAPTTTTTRAPSRLREIDGSLSSSAWVCAPLLLAASALAYTTLG
ncbi:putative mucin TcMUCII [Trypanosoma cruzi]|nr:putative mucin TcMUCII [Trypanosoma cruzi]